MASHVKSVFKMGLPLLGGVVGLMLVCFAAIGFLLFQQGAAATDMQRRSLQTAGEKLVEGYLQQQESLASQIASQPADIIVGAIPGTLKAVVVPMAGDVPTDLSFADQDFLRRAQAAHGALPPEAGVQPDHRQVLSLVKRMKTGDALLMIKVPLDPLLKELEALVSENGGSLLLQQKLVKDTDPVTLLSVRADGLSAGPASEANPNWRLQLRPAPASGIVYVEAGLLGVVFLGVTLLVFAGMKILDRRLEEDLRSLRRVAEGEMLTSPLSFTVMQDIWNLMTTMKPAKSAPRAVSSEVHAANVAEIVQAAEALPELMPVPKPVDEAAAVADGVDGEEILLPEQEAPHEAKELSALEFTLSKDKAVSDADPHGDFPAHVFRMYDIRGKAVTELTPDFAHAVGRAIGTRARDAGQDLVVVGRDCRLSSEELCEALMAGLTETGCDVVNIGEVPTPVLYFAAKNIGTGTGVMVTGSHNPGADNGFKIMVAGHTLVGEEVSALRSLILGGKFAQGAGVITEQSVNDEYLSRITEDVLLARNFSVVVDGGNGVAGAMAVRMLEEMGCTVSPLYCDADGNFPNHDPDPTRPENLEDLLSDVAISGADVGIALDGDGDRLVIVTNSTRIVPSDRLMMLFAREILATQPGADILFDVKCSRDLVSVITSSGGRPVMTRTGHAWLKSALEESPAPLAGEYSGHFIFCDRWQGFDDGLYAAARFLEILAQSGGTADDLFAAFPERISTPELNIPISEDYKFEVVQRLVEQASSISDATVNTIDGLRVEWPYGWGLVRASNTGPYLVARFEANDDDALDRVKYSFKELLGQVDPMLLLPF